MHSMLWEIFRQVGAGKQVGDGASWSGLLEGFECVTRRVHESNIQREFLNSAMWHWGDPAERGLLPVYQLVWPSAVSGLYPWEEGDHDYTRDMQAPLYLASPIGNALN
jgi:hypothetical protein